MRYAVIMLYEVQGKRYEICGMRYEKLCMWGEI